MFRLLVVALAMFAGPAWADGFDSKAIRGQWGTLDGLCYMMEDSNGPVSEEVSAIACEVRETLGDLLEENGWCFIMGDRDWTTACPVKAANKN